MINDVLIVDAVRKVFQRKSSEILKCQTSS